MSCATTLPPLSLALLCVFAVALTAYATVATRRARARLKHPAPMRRFWIGFLLGNSLPPQTASDSYRTSLADPDMTVLMAESRTFQRNAAGMAALFALVFFAVYASC